MGFFKVGMLLKSSKALKFSNLATEAFTVLETFAKFFLN